jgi:hypothetical protein
MTDLLLILVDEWGIGGILNNKVEHIRYTSRGVDNVLVTAIGCATVNY